MIFTRWGNPIKITAYCGKHQDKDFPAPMMLVKVDYIEEPNVDGYEFAHTLKADNGLQEIEDAIIAAPEVVLKGKDLKTALREAR